MTTTTITPPRTDLDAGVAVLDEHVIGWRDKVDADGLDMGDPCCCVLGQVFGDFYTGIETLDVGYGNAERLGFDGDDYPALGEAWRRELR